ncbi:hypothetical protein QI155_03215 [Thermodesulfovibrio sp. 1176]|uniref:hypothetical protein n=1 Tax=Thermodesulfovibrio sp. 1176 TaxID=3043424 RepID=UPI0024822977|nr:hypothetical protein [Thermodesulfovibrio sp. 1176]MDI1471533.1 hypothetical protein [Thermodesulfovibrio sp. 1176]
MKIEEKEKQLKILSSSDRELLIFIRNKIWQLEHSLEAIVQHIAETEDLVVNAFEIIDEIRELLKTNKNRKEFEL